MLTPNETKQLDAIADDVSRLKLSDDDRKRLEALEKELSEIDLDFLLR